MTIFEAYNNTKKELESAGIEDFAFEARQIIRHITGYNNTQILSKYNTQLNTFQQNKLTAIIKQRLIRYPLQYIFTYWSFFGRDFKVGPGVLIPRSDTELIIEKIGDKIKGKSDIKALDLCCGTGCIGITLALEYENIAVCNMIDKYDEALNYARQNIVALSVPNCNAIKGDALLPITGRYDLIVSNPPYVREEELNNLQPEISFEPKTALVAGNEGDEFYKAIAKNAYISLNDNGILAFEIGDTQGQQVRKILEENGYSNIEVFKDYNNKDRVVTGEKII